MCCWGSETRPRIRYNLTTNGHVNCWCKGKTQAQNYAVFTNQVFSCDFGLFLGYFLQFVDNFGKLMGFFLVSQAFVGIFMQFLGLIFFGSNLGHVKQIVFFQVCLKPVLFLQYLSAQEPQAESNLARVIESVTLMTPGQCEAGLGVNVTLPTVSISQHCLGNMCCSLRDSFPSNKLLNFYLQCLL